MWYKSKINLLWYNKTQSKYHSRFTWIKPLHFLVANSAFFNTDISFSTLALCTWNPQSGRVRDWKSPSAVFSSSQVILRFNQLNRTNTEHNKRKATLIIQVQESTYICICLHESSYYKLRIPICNAHILNSMRNKCTSCHAHIQINESIYQTIKQQQWYISQYAHVSTWLGSCATTNTAPTQFLLCA